MSTRGGGAGGAIVNISSTATRLGSPNQWTHYAATKGAVEVFTTGLAMLGLAVLSWLVEVKGWAWLWARPIEAFGRNAITAYILHILLLWTLKAPLLVPLYWLGDNLLSPRASSIPPVLILLFLTWLPVAIMAWRKITIRV